MHFDGIKNPSNFLNYHFFFGKPQAKIDNKAVKIIKIGICFFSRFFPHIVSFCLLTVQLVLIRASFTVKGIHIILSLCIHGLAADIYRD